MLGRPCGCLSCTAVENPRLQGDLDPLPAKRQRKAVSREFEFSRPPPLHLLRYAWEQAAPDKPWECSAARNGNQLPPGVSIAQAAEAYDRCAVPIKFSQGGTVFQRRRQRQAEAAEQAAAPTQPEERHPAKRRRRRDDVAVPQMVQSAAVRVEGKDGTRPSGRSVTGCFCCKARTPY